MKIGVVEHNSGQIYLFEIFEYYKVEGNGNIKKFYMGVMNNKTIHSKKSSLESLVIAISDFINKEETYYDWLVVKQSRAT